MNSPSGFLIARTKAKTEFFISSSAYDRPQWKSLREATVYLTVEMAERAMSKIIKSGLAYESRLVSLSEAMSFDFPNGERATGKGKFAETPGGNEFPKDDAVGDLGDPTNPDDKSDEMTADDSSGSEACPECGHEPCTCENNDEDHNDEPQTCSQCNGSGEGQYEGEKCISCGGSGVDGSGVDELEGREHDEFGHQEEEENAFSRAKFSRGQSVMYRGAKHKVLADDGTGVSTIAPTGDNSKPIRANNTALAAVSEGIDTKVTKITYDKPAMTDAKFDQGGDAHDEKVKVPSNVSLDLKAAIAEFSKGAEFNNTRDDAKASFMMTTAEALKTLQAYLDLGTVAGIKQAQISLTSMMSPIVNNVPTSVLKFIHMGGKKQTLKDLFDSKRTDKKGAQDGDE